MRMGSKWVVCLTMMLGGLNAAAAPQLRVQVDQRGDFILIGNTLAHECASGTPAPVVGTVGNCGVNTNDTAPDIYWRADAPLMGQVQAASSISMSQARSTAVLNLPAGATVTHAYLYWAAGIFFPVTPDTLATLDRPGVFTTSVTAIQTYVANNSYHAAADVTSWVKTHGAGAYRVSDVLMPSLVDVNDGNLFAGWWMAVFYTLSSDPLRTLILYDGFDSVSTGTEQTTTFQGFLVPPAFDSAKLGVVSFEGDQYLPGDQLFFNDVVALSNAQNPANNFFNSTRTALGAPVSNIGDLPQLTGTPQSMSGMDLDVIDISNKLTAGQSSAFFRASSTQDVFHLAGFMVSIPVLEPILSTSTKSVVDVNGGALRPGDVLEYTISVANTGSDSAINTVMTDSLPQGMEYDRASIRITSGPNQGPKTDAPGDDQADYNEATRTLTVRLGTGANATNGGVLTVGGTTTVVFRATINANVSGLLNNQAFINAGGMQGSSPVDIPTDGNGPVEGSPPTSVVVDACETDADCGAPTPHCHISATPNFCVACLFNGHCKSNETCDVFSNTCICIPTGVEVCDGLDNDCSGFADDGFHVGETCTVGIGGCTGQGVIECDGTGGARCNAVEGEQHPETCDGVDDDCDGSLNNGNPDGGGSCDTGMLGLCSVGTLVCSATGTLECVPLVLPDTVPEQCNLVDEDCDGILNNDLPDVGQSCTTPLPGLCSQGILTCTDLGNLECIALIQPGTLAEMCNGQDDDCDGTNDNGFNVGTECWAGIGACAASGEIVCNGQGGASCNATPGPHAPEVCGNNSDEDCDGTLDNGCPDTDQDGLLDAVEVNANLDPNDADSDDDGVLDGQEPQWSDDTDDDGLSNALDPDSDDDGLTDGTEMGLSCDNPDTKPTQHHCTPDADQGATTTDPLGADSDDDGKLDGEEDMNGNGQVDPGERDPGNPTDGAWECAVDGECGDATSGMVCDFHACTSGCRGSGGNGCPVEMACSSVDTTIGQCVTVVPSSSSGVVPGSSSALSGEPGNSSQDDHSSSAPDSSTSMSQESPSSSASPPSSSADGSSSTSGGMVPSSSASGVTSPSSSGGTSLSSSASQSSSMGILKSSSSGGTSLSSSASQSSSMGVLSSSHVLAVSSTSGVIPSSSGQATVEDGADENQDESADGCACNASHASTPLALLFAVLAMGLVRRRQRAS